MDVALLFFFFFGGGGLLQPPPSVEFLPGLIASSSDRRGRAGASQPSCGAVQLWAASELAREFGSAGAQRLAGSLPVMLGKWECGRIHSDAGFDNACSHANSSLAVFHVDYGVLLQSYRVSVGQANG